MTPKERIIELYRRNVKGKTPNVDGRNERHDGRKGHWLEEQFGINPNADNKADLWGYELKNETSSKTTFGDWSANVYVFTTPRYASLFAGRYKYEKQDSFLRIFGNPNENKDGRYSWSGSPCPKIDSYNDFGQILLVESNNDIVALYSYSQDKRKDKANIVPKELQIENLEIARWYGEHSPTSRKRDRCLKELVSKQSELEYLNDADVEKISSDLSSHLKEHVVNDPDLLWDALILNWIFFDLGFPQALTMSTARDAAENSLDANSSAFLEAFRDIIQLQRPLSPDDPLTKMLTNLVNYCQKKQEQSLVSEIMSEMDKTDALDRGSYLYQKIACDEVIDTNVLFSLPPAAIAKCFEKGSAPSQVSIIKLIRQIKEKDSLGQGETEWLVKLEKQFDELNVSSRMGKGRLSVMKNAIQEIIEKDDAMRAAKGTK